MRDETTEKAFHESDLMPYEGAKESVEVGDIVMTRSPSSHGPMQVTAVWPGGRVVAVSIPREEI